MPEVSTVILMVVLTDVDGGLNVALEFAGKPLAVSVTVPAFAAKPVVSRNPALLPALTVAVLKIGVIPNPVMVVTSEALVWLGFARPIPNIWTVLVIGDGGLGPTLTVSVMGG